MERKTSIIILTYNNLAYTKKCLNSIRKYTEENTYEIIVIDNNSTDKTKDYLEKQTDIKTIFNKENLGFPKACNQGLKLADSKNDILLLNNDTIVTTNWLSNLKKCLYSSKRIGACGPVCNQNENKQGVDFTYDNLKTMQKLARKNNISDSSKWEEKLFLIGYCLLIKREVIKKLKKLDENYSPGYIEDNDFCLRIIKNNYKLILCHDTFIHHYLGTSFRKDLTKFYTILSKNRNYFYNKWHFQTPIFDEYKEASYPFLEDNKKILDFNSSLGVNSLSIKYKFKAINIELVEENKNKRKFSSKFFQTYKKLSKAKKNYYDYILIGNYLEKISNKETFLNELKKHLKHGGYIIGEFNNISNIKNINKLLKGENIYKETNNFSPKTMEETLRGHFLITNYFKWYQTLSEEENIIYNLLKDKYPFLDYTYYTFKAKVE